MKAIVVTDQAAGTAGMKLSERPEPAPAINDVVVQVHASGFTWDELTWPSTWTDRLGRDRTPVIPASFRPGQTIVQEIVPDREARGAPAPAGDASGGSAATLAWTVTILAATLGIVWLRARAKQTERRRTVERVEHQAGALPAVPVRINLQSGEIGLFETPAGRSPFPDVTIDRAVIRSMVEDHWRNFLSVSASGNLQLAAGLIKNFEDRIRDTAALMEPTKAKIFSLAVEEERELVLNEANRNPSLLKMRLGLLSAAQQTLPIPHYQPQSIGEMAVRTAIQATIWETVITLFRR